MPRTTRTPVPAHAEAPSLDQVADQLALDLRMAADRVSRQLASIARDVERAQADLAAGHLPQVGIGSYDLLGRDAAELAGHLGRLTTLVEYASAVIGAEATQAAFDRGTSR